MSDASRNKSRTPLLLGGAVVVAAVIAVVFVLPAETGFDPLGTGEATGLDKIATPDNPELIRGIARMERQEVLSLSDVAPEPLEGASDSWEHELAPFESIEFKYHLLEGQPVAFSWEASGPLNYDMHAHPYAGGAALTESYGVDEASAMQGIYTPAFTGEHGWYWSNRSGDTVTLRLSASGPIAGSTVYDPQGALDRAVEGAVEADEGIVEGHAMQGAAQQ